MLRGRMAASSAARPPKLHGRPQPPSVPLDAYNLDTAQARRSIRKLAELRPAIACPGHLGPLTGPDVVAQLEAAAAA
jgi:hydroxyacylglutathione hydrolase